jgi:hypothetical protein
VYEKLGLFLLAGGSDPYRTVSLCLEGVMKTALGNIPAIRKCRDGIFLINRSNLDATIAGVDISTALEIIKSNDLKHIVRQYIENAMETAPKYIDFDAVDDTTLEDTDIFTTLEII